MGSILRIAGAVVYDPTTRLCFLVLSSHGFVPMVAAIREMSMLGIKDN